MNKKYMVTINFTYTQEIEADNEDDAISKARDYLNTGDKPTETDASAIEE